MTFLTNYFLGVRIFIWLIVSCQFIFGVCFYAWLMRELLKKQYYEIRFPHKLIKVIIHYSTNKFTEFWRIIPNDKSLYVEDMKYYYNDEKLINKNRELFIQKTKIIVDSKTYDIKNNSMIQKNRSKFPEIHYFFNNPFPIDFNVTDLELKVNAKQLKDFSDNDLFQKLLTLEDGKNLSKILLIICVINTIGILFLIAKVFEFIK